MKKFADLLGYPVALFVVYVLVGFITWSKDPDSWEMAHRVIWVVWGCTWGEMLRYRIKKWMDI